MQRSDLYADPVGTPRERREALAAAAMARGRVRVVYLDGHDLRSVVFGWVVKLDGSYVVLSTSRTGEGMPERIPLRSVIHVAPAEGASS